MAPESPGVVTLLSRLETARAAARFGEVLDLARELVDLLDADAAARGDAGAGERLETAAMTYAAACAAAAESLAELGDHRGALEWLARGRRVAGDAADSLLAVAEATALALAGRANDALPVLARAVTTTRANDDACALVDALSALGGACLLTGRADDALAAVDEAMALRERRCPGASPTPLLTTRAGASAGLGRLEAAGAAAAGAVESAQRRGERGREGWAWLAAAEVARARGDTAEAGRCLDEAQEVAEERAMRPLLERCRAALRRLPP